MVGGRNFRAESVDKKFGLPGFEHEPLAVQLFGSCAALYDNRKSRSMNAGSPWGKYMRIILRPGVR